MTDILTLITKQQTVDEYGDPVIQETARTVYCEEESIGQREFYQAHALGLKPELKFLLQDYLDYAGEKIVEHEGVRYEVLRTYRSGQQLEIIVTRGVDA